MATAGVAGRPWVAILNVREKVTPRVSASLSEHVKPRLTLNFEILTFTTYDLSNRFLPRYCVAASFYDMFGPTGGVPRYANSFGPRGRAEPLLALHDGTHIMLYKFSVSLEVGAVCFLRSAPSFAPLQCC